MRSRWVVLAILMVCVALIPHAIAAGDRPRLAPGKRVPLPTTFALNIGGLGQAYSITIRGPDLLYESRVNEHTPPYTLVTTKKTIRPSPERWVRFWKTMDSVDLWRWRTDYPNPPNIACGTAWAVSIDFDGRRLRSTGHNNYPGTGPFPGPESAFGSFLTAVEDLLGSETFH
jgi:hypothetical protein